MNERDEKIREALATATRFCSSDGRRLIKEALALLSAEPQPVPGREEAARELVRKIRSSWISAGGHWDPIYTEDVAVSLILAYAAEVEARVRTECADMIPPPRGIDWMENRGDLFSEGWNAAVEQTRAAIQGKE